jgi:protein xylosyltransferase
MCGGYLAMNVYLTGFGVNAADYVSATNVNHSHHQQQQQQVVRIVFVLTVNGRALRQVTRLLRAIYRPHHYYYIHVDSRQEYLHRELSALSSHFMNIRMSASRHSTIWGGASLLTTLLECISELMLIDTWHWDYFLNLSESDYPIKPVEELELFLAVNKGKNFVKSHGKDTPRFIRKQGLNMLFYECDNHMWRLGARQPQDGIRIDGGSDWVCLSHQFAQYLLTEDLLVTGLKQYWKYALLPAESFFHTVLQNSIYCTTVVNNNLHFTNWRRKQGCKCQYKHVVDWCGCSPNDLLPGDKQKIQSLRHRPIYFARKFEAVVSQTIINQVDEFIYADSLPADTPGLNSFWLNEYHYKDVNATVSMSSLHSHYIPFARHALQHVAATTSCQLALTQLLEVTVYMSADKFSGLIVSFNASISGDNTSVYGESKLSRVMSVEVLLQPTLNLMFHSKQTSHLVAQRLQHLQVGSEYDPKEEIFRNYAGLLDSESEVIIQLSWRSGRLVTGSSTSVQLLTFDPTNVVVDVVDVSVNVEGATVFVHRPALTRPLRSGLWMVQVVEQSTDTQTQFNDRQQQSTETVIARRGFLVLPSSVVQDSGGQAEFDLLIAKAWKVTAGCLVSSTATDKSCYQEMSACLRTPWSTRYPDPKSWLVSTQQ